MRVDFLSNLLGAPERFNAPMKAPSDANRATAFYYVARYIFACLFHIVWRLEVRGASNVPQIGPAIIASNHRAYADPPLVGVGLSRPIHFLAKKELFAFAPIGWVLRQWHAHPLNRAAGTAALKVAQEILDKGGVVVLFPEGRRSQTDELQKPKAGVGMLAIKTGVPIIPTYIQNSGYILGFKKLTICYGTPIQSAHFTDYEALAHEVMRRIQILKDGLG